MVYILHFVYLQITQFFGCLLLHRSYWDRVNKLEIIVVFICIIRLVSRIFLEAPRLTEEAKVFLREYCEDLVGTCSS